MSPQLLTGETELIKTRQHWWVLVPTVLAFAVVLTAIIVLARVVPAKVSGRDISGIKQVVVLVVIALEVLFLAARVLRWRFATYTLTDRRIVVSRGVISRVTESISLDRVQDTVLRKPLAERLLGAGDLEIESAGREGAEVLHLIPHAETFYNGLLQAIENHRAGAGYPVQQPVPGYAPPPPPPPPATYGPRGGV